MLNNIVIFGPTAIGKSLLAIKLAKLFGTDVISADSVQLFKDLNIGSAKIKEEEKQGIKHHLIDIKEINERYSAYSFASEAENILKDLEKRGKIGIIAGGTGLYLKALVDGIISVPSNKERRDSLMQDRDAYAKLVKIDEEYAKKINPRDSKRVSRRIEIFELTGNAKIENRAPLFKYKKYGLIQDRDQLYESINGRVDQMIKDGFIEEAEDIFKKHGELKIIGYYELAQLFQNRLTLEEAISLIKQKTRNYAKRQMTWMKNNEYRIIDIDKEDAFEVIKSDFKI